jgi:hypothetical protein
MSSIEDIMYEAYNLSVKDEVLTKVCELKQKEKYKFVDLASVYTIAFNKVLKEVVIK